MEPSSAMRAFLHQIVQCAITKALLDKVKFKDNIQFIAEVKVTVDKNNPIDFVVSEEIPKKSAQIYQLQLNSLSGEENHGRNMVSNQLPATEGESSAIQGEGSSSVAAEQNTLGENVWSFGKDVNHMEENKALGKDKAERQVTDSATQTDELIPEPTLKRKPRKSTNQRKKSKSPTGFPVKSAAQLHEDSEVLDIKMEVISDDEHPASSVTVVSPLPPSDLQTSTGNSFLCPLCPTQFRSQRALENHLRVTHDIGNIYMCEVSSCQEMCQSSTALHQHMMAEHGAQEGVDVEPQRPAKKKRGRKPKNLNKETSAVPKLKETVSSPIVIRMSGRKKATKPATGRKAGRKKGGQARKPKVATTAADKGMQKCTECSKEYPSKRSLNRHIRTAHDVKKYQCDICGKIFTSKETLYHHRRGIHSENKPYKCNECDASFNFNHSLRLHRLKHSGVRPFECTECNKTYLTANHLKMHMEGVHGSKKNYKCKICSKSFSYRTSLKVHEMTHGEYRPYRCNVCGQGFVNSHSLKYHKESKHSQNTWFECDLCNKKYKTEFLMKSHRRRHTADVTRYMCDICGRQFMYKSTLEIHAAVHSDEKSFQCSTCGKSFKTYATLYSHQYVHKSESPYNCPECGKSFKTKERCKAHQKRHSGLKPFTCEQCGRSFPDKGGLSKHTKTVHCEVKMFVCDICGKACSRADNLRVHMKIHSKQVDPSVPGRTQFSRQLDKTVTVMESPLDINPKDPQGGNFMKISSPNSSPSHTVTVPRIFPDRSDTTPFIPNVSDPVAIPTGSTLPGHGILLTTQESDLGGVANSGIHPPNPLVTHPAASTTQTPPGYMYMWPYLTSQHHTDQTGANNQFF